jgi:hypothetical protein
LGTERDKRERFGIDLMDAQAAFNLHQQAIY